MYPGGLVGYIKKLYCFNTGENEIFTEYGNIVHFLIQIDKSTPLMLDTAVRFKNSMKDMIMRLQPADSYYGDREEETEGLKISWFDFGSSRMDSRVYNLEGICRSISP